MFIMPVSVGKNVGVIIWVVLAGSLAGLPLQKPQQGLEEPLP